MADPNHEAARQPLRSRRFSSLPPGKHQPSQHSTSRGNGSAAPRRQERYGTKLGGRGPESQLLAATGRSCQTSLAAMGETHRSVIERAVDAMMEGGAIDFSETEKRRERALEQQTRVVP